MFLRPAVVFAIVSGAHGTALAQQARPADITVETAQNAAATGPLDGEVYIGGQQPPAMPQQVVTQGQPQYVGAYGTGESFQFDAMAAAQSSATVLYERPLARWRDPLTLPKTRMECVKWASGRIPFDGTWKTCIGHKYQSQWMFVSARLQVSTARPTNIGKVVEECLATAAVAGLISGLLTEGAAAAPAAEAAMKACLAAKLSRNLLTVSVRTNSAWGGWE